MYEYLWHTVLHRTEDFWCITPQKFFLQLDVHAEFNKPKEEKKTTREEWI